MTHGIQRACGRCTECCNTHTVVEMQKAQFTWCSQCKISRGCKIYTERPSACQAFTCAWLEGLGGAEHRPDKLGVVCSAWELLYNGRLLKGMTLTIRNPRQVHRARFEVLKRELRREGWIIEIYEHEAEPVIIVPPNMGLTEADGPHILYALFRTELERPDTAAYVLRKFRESGIDLIPVRLPDIGCVS